MQREELDRRIKRSAIFTRVFKTPDGERALEEIKKRVGYENDSFNENPYKMAHNCGMKAIVKFIEKAMNEDIEKWRKVHKEMKDAEATKERKQE